MKQMKKIGLLFLLCGMNIFAPTEVLFRMAKHANNLHIRNRLLQFIRNESKAIHSAMYVFSDKKVAQEMVNAHQRGVEINIVVDQQSWRTSYGKGHFLHDHGVPLYVFDPENREYLKTLMHAKMFIFEEQGIAWHGSYNVTQTAATKNYELVTICDEPDVLNSFREFFNVVIADDRTRYIEPAVEV